MCPSSTTTAANAILTEAGDHDLHDEHHSPARLIAGPISVSFGAITNECERESQELPEAQSLSHRVTSDIAMGLTPTTNAMRYRKTMRLRLSNHHERGLTRDMNSLHW